MSDYVRNDVNKMKGKKPSESVVEMTELVLPNDTNLLGNLLGGRLMHWIDIAGAMSASRHSNSVVATVALDSLDFRHPIHVGEMVRLSSKITWAGKTSMEVTIKVYSEDYRNNSVNMTSRAFIAYVALDDEGNSKQVPALFPETEEEKKDYIDAELRRNERLKKKNKNS